MVSSRPLKIVVVLGPTASGKSALALQLAKQFNGEIINSDSRQFYQEMNIGTAKPSEDERQQVPHHLVDCTSVQDPWDVARFVEQASLCVRDITARGRLPILVGGTGLYLRSLLVGMDSIPPIPDFVRAQIAQDTEQMGLSAMYARLQKLDPVGAARLQPKDSQRILRALEVVVHTQKPIHEYWQQKGSSVFSALQLGLDWPRETLYQRIDERVDTMFADGLKAEVQSLVQRFPDNVVLKKTIGYQEWLQLGFKNDDLVKIEIQKHTRNFAKRQVTWFRKETEIVWQNSTEYHFFQKSVESFLA